VVLVTSLTGGDFTVSTAPSRLPVASRGSLAAHEASSAALARTLQRQQIALDAESRRGYLSTFDPGSAAATQQASAIYANVKALHASVTDLRYVAGSVAALSGTRQRRLRGRAWTAEVELSWRLHHYDKHRASATLSFTFVRRGGTAYVADMTATAGSREPVWLLGDLKVRRSGRTLAAAATARGAVRLDRLLRSAVVDVRGFVPSWRGTLVAYEPSSAAGFDAVLGAAHDKQSGFAAVTTTVDGSTSPKAPVAIVVNPTIFDALSPVGASVVLSHEATHAATGATTARLPLWLAEGVADYVGVGAVDVPLSRSAGALICDLRRHGVPTSLPADARFAATGRRSELSYEQAWLAARLIARRYGETRLLALYERVVAVPQAVTAAFRSELGTTLKAFTRQWRDSLEALVRAS
jgi:hypothetical protein